MKVKVSDLIARFIAERQLDHIFGIIGSGNAHIFDSIHFSGKTEIVCVHHEQAACMAMQTYYRITGKASVSLLTTGAGSSNGVTGVMSAWADSIPGLVISGNENAKFCFPENPLRMWGIQGYDSPEMARIITKYGARVLDPVRILFELEKAYHISTHGRPGPCWIDVPLNIQSAQVEEADLVRFDAAAFEAEASVPDIAEAVQQVLASLRKAQRPLVWLGNGIRLADAADRLVPLLRQLDVPYLVSWAGIDMVDSDHPRVYGRAGVYGQRAANFILQNCDYLLTVGTRLAVPQVGYDLTEFCRGAEVAVVDIDPAEAVKHGSRIALPIVADAGRFLDALLAGIGQTPLVAPQPWISYCDRARADFPWIGPEHADQGEFINSYSFMERLERHFKPDQIVVTDMGTALLSGHQVLKMKEGQRLLTSTGLGEMGYGLPGAIGASFARNRGEVLCLNCDGGMMMNLQELQTVAHHQLPIKLIIFNNDGYLMIKHTQKATLQGRFAGVDRKSGVSCPDFSKLAAAFGFPAFQIRTWDDVDAILPRVQQHDGPVICEVFMHPEQLFVPKLSLAVQKDGSYVSPPLEDLSPFLSRETIRAQMLVGIHPKSERIGS